MFLDLGQNSDHKKTIIDPVSVVVLAGKSLIIKQIHTFTSSILERFRDRQSTTNTNTCG